MTLIQCVCVVLLLNCDFTLTPNMHWPQSPWSGDVTAAGIHRDPCRRCVREFEIIQALHLQTSRNAGMEKGEDSSDLENYVLVLLNPVSDCFPPQLGD